MIDYCKKIGLTFGADRVTIHEGPSKEDKDGVRDTSRVSEEDSVDFDFLPEDEPRVGNGLVPGIDRVLKIINRLIASVE